MEDILVHRCRFTSFAFLEHWPLRFLSTFSEVLAYVFLSLADGSMFYVFFHLQSDESLVLYHFQCHGWRENGLTRAESLVYLQQQVHKVEPGEHRGPIIVHCRYRSNFEPVL